MVHSVWREINLAWPCDGAFIDEHTVEKLRFPQRRQYPGQLFGTKADTPAKPVLEADEEA